MKKEQHVFLFTPATWLGEGEIILNMVDEVLVYFTRWKIHPIDGEGKIRCSQEIEVKGLSDIMVNEFVFSDLKDKKFFVQIENQEMGKVSGNGFFTDDSIGWEFHNEAEDFEGFEIYDKVDDKYEVRAEYATSDQFRTQIKGKLWQKLET